MDLFLHQQFLCQKFLRKKFLCYKFLSIYFRNGLFCGIYFVYLIMSKVFDAISTIYEIVGLKFNDSYNPKFALDTATGFLKQKYTINK